LVLKFRIINLSNLLQKQIKTENEFYKTYLYVHRDKLKLLNSSITIKQHHITILNALIISSTMFFEFLVALKRAFFKECNNRKRIHYLELVYLVTALVPSLTACLANSPGNKRRTAVWISRLVMVERLL